MPSPIAFTDAALVGRNVIYPGAEDPLAVGEAVGGIVHHGSARATPQRYVEPRNLVAEITHLVDADEAAHG